MTKIRLLPGGAFEIHTESETIKGRFTLWALKAYSIHIGANSLYDLITYLNKAKDRLLINVSGLILHAVEYQWGRMYPQTPFPYKLRDAYAWAEEIGSAHITALLSHAITGEAKDKRKKGKGKDRTTWLELEQAAIEAGLTPGEFLDSALPQIHTLLKGYDKRIISQWEQIRWLGYITHVHSVEAKNRLSISQLMPLPSDPTEKEIKKQQQRDARHLLKATEQAMKVFREKGLIS